MEEPENIKAFNYLTLRLFDRLYEAFPDPIILSTWLFAEEIAEQNGGVPQEATNQTLISNTISWLASEGFVRYSAMKPAGVYQWLVLTLNGLAILGYMPASIGNKESPSVIDRTREIIGKGAAAAGTEIMHATVSAAFTAMMRHAGVG